MTNVLVKIMLFFIILLIAGYAQLQEKTDKRITELEKQVITLKQELQYVQKESPLKSKSRQDH